jgi:uncharacterized RDD family membrane protein YckC
MAEHTDVETNTQSIPDWHEKARYVGFFARALAVLIDTAALALPLAFIYALLDGFVWSGSGLTQQDFELLLAQAEGNAQAAQDLLLRLHESGVIARQLIVELGVITAVSVLFIWLWSRYAASPGKMLLKMRIVDATTGRTPTVGQNTKRYLGYFVSTLPCMFGFLRIAWHKRKQGWHDHMAHTVVVYSDSLPPALQTDLPEDERKDT